jgi:hypothetical protein
VVLALTRTWAKQKGHAPCAMTLIRLEQDCRWIRGRLVNWKRGSGSGRGRRVHHLEDESRCVEGINLSDPHGAELSTQQQKTKYVSEIC